MASHGCARILVVNDDPHLLSVWAGMLRQKGVDVMTAASAEQVDHTVHAGFRPQAIVVHVATSPACIGVEVLRRRREGDPFAAVPTLAITSSQPALRLAQELHASAVIDRPFDPRALLSALRTLCGAT